MATTGVLHDRASIATAVRDLECSSSGALPDNAQRLLVDALHERAAAARLDTRQVRSAWAAMRQTLGLDPCRQETNPLGQQAIGFVAARILGSGGPLNQERLGAIDRQRDAPMRLAPTPRLPWPMGESKHIIDIARDALGPARALDFMVLWKAWPGPVLGTPEAPDTSTTGQQRLFTRLPWKEKLDSDDMMRVLRGEVLLLENPRTKQLDVVARDHNTLDVLLAAWALGRPMPERILHLDRHSDYVKPHVDEGTFGPRYLAGASQAYAWWSLLDVIQRADGRTPLADPARVEFVTYLSPKQDLDEGRKLNGGRTSPRRAADTQWKGVGGRVERAPPDFVSYDLDLSMPSDQMHGTKPMLRDPVFARVMADAGLRLFVVSPSFSGGGDLVSRSDVKHSPATYARVLNVVRRSGNNAA